MSSLPRTIVPMEPSNLPQTDEPGALPRYADLAARLLEEHAELFRVTAPLRRPEPVAWRRAVPGRRRAGRSPQLSLPLRPRVLIGGTEPR
ncbi:MAG: hypothetical protein ACREN2_05040 [Candidatus Dormibacteria bacterium]